MATVIKKISELEQLTDLSSSSNVIIEENGKAKRFSAQNIGKVKTVNGIEPDENGNIAITGSVVAGGVQPDWNQTDVNSADFIKNKPFYDAGDPIEISVFNKDNIVFEAEENDDGNIMYIYNMYDDGIRMEFDLDTTYTVKIDGIAYTTESKNLMGEINFIGNPNILSSTVPDTGEPFVIYDGYIVLSLSGETHSVSITKTITAIEKEIAPYSSYTFSNLDMYPVLLNLTDFDFSNISKGDIIVVTVDGVEYTNTVMLFEGFPVFGNLGLVGSGDDTGEPYLAMYAMGMSGLYFLDQNVSLSLTIDKIIDDFTSENIFTNSALKMDFNYNEGGYYLENDIGSITLEADTTYRIIVDGVESTATSYVLNDTTILLDVSTDDCQICIEYDSVDGYNVIYYYGNASMTSSAQISINGYVSGVKKLDKKYLPDNIDMPIASGSRAGAVKVWGRGSGLSDDSNYSRIYLDTDNNTIYARVPSSMSTLTFTGATYGSYNGSSNVTINIPSGTPSVTSSDNGKVLGVVNGQWVKKNLGTLAFTGAVYGTYDGSGSATINIPYGVPSVTTSDNGKVLTVVNGSWSTSVIKELPETTTDNNGAFLRIVNGVPTWVVLENAEDGAY